MPDVPDTLIKDVSLALLKIKPDSAAARDGKYYGFTPPGNYAPVEALLLRFETNPDRAKQFDLRDVVRKYAFPLIVGAGTILLGALLLLGYLVLAHRRLQSSYRERTRLDAMLREVNASLEDKVTQRTLQLQESETRLLSILNSSPIAVRIADQGGHRIVFSNRSYEKLIGIEEGLAEGKDPVSYYAHPEDYQAVLQELITTGKQVTDRLMELTIPNRGTRWALASYVPFQMAEGKKGVLGWFYDITERKLIENEMKEEKEIIRAQNDFMNTIFESEPECVKVIALNGDLQKMNRTGLAMLEVASVEEARQHGLIEFVTPEYRKSFAALMKKVFQGESGQLEFMIRGKNGTLRWLETHAAPLRDANGRVTSLLGVTRDITQTKEHQKQLEHIAHYDALTNLPNRVLLADRLQQAMAHCQRRGQSLAVVYLDLDGFKAVNDKYGHDVGDELLIVVAHRMKSVLREGDSLARIGGDEFIAVLVDLEQPQDCDPVLARLLQAAADPVSVSSTVMQVSASAGVTFYPQDGADTDQLMRHADQAMYLAKQAGKNRYHLFDVAQDAAVQIQRESLEHIRLALEKREFVLYYQPKVNMRTGRVIGAEALIRWQHPERGLLPPAAFLPIIEEHPFSVELGEWVIDTALEQMAAWHQEGLEIPVSVNIGARQLQQEDFVKKLAESLSSHPNIPRHWLELEVLETSALDDIAQISRIMRACREIGVHFALDDFGTGYSSLTYLKHLPAELIKIDQSFVRDMLDDADDLAIVNGVIGLASAFHRKVIAEGVETVAHGTLLLSLGCELAQGYGIARPMPAADIPGWVASWRPNAAWIEISHDLNELTNAIQTN